MPKSEMEEFLARHPDVRHLDALFVDMCGVMRGKRYPRAEMEKILSGGLQIPFTIYLLDALGGSSDPGGRGFDDGDPDGTGIPIPGTLAAVPWSDVPAAQVVMTMVDDAGRPAMVDPRNVLAKVEERFHGLGLTPVVAVELEFYLIDRERDAEGRPRAAVNPATGKREESIQVYGIAELDDFGPVIRDMEDACAGQGIPTAAVTSEYSPAQFEINLGHVKSAVTAADHGAMLRHVVLSVARRHGMQATFMSRPFPEQTGSGMHAHLSLLDGDGVNVFSDPDEAGSEVLKHAIGGLKALMGESMAFFAPNINAYRRFGPDLFVPVSKSWAVNNRSVAFRIPTGSADARRFEHRVSGADANPYLVLAAILAGVHHGITNKIDPGPPAEGNAGAAMDGDLPFTIDHALKAMNEARILPGYIEPEYLTLYTETKRGELAMLRAVASPLEYKWYL